MHPCTMKRQAFCVALLAEGVDRNSLLCHRNATPDVALLAEGVDRNLLSDSEIAKGKVSPSSRRAWIEIAPKIDSTNVVCVALLAEGVDRNSVKPLASRP